MNPAKNVVDNAEIAALLRELADLSEFAGENPFKVRAYRAAAHTVETFARPFAKMLQEGRDISKIPTIGEKIAAKIKEAVAHGKITALERLKARYPQGITALLQIEGVGPKRAKVLYEKLGIDSPEALRHAAEAGKIRRLEGFGEKLEQKLYRAVTLAKKSGKRFLYAEAEAYAEAIVRYLEQSALAQEVTVAGSFRRRKETVGDLDIVAVSQDPPALIRHFIAYASTKEVLSQGTTRASIVLENDLQIDLRVVTSPYYDTTLHYFTGAKSHVLALRRIAVAHDMKINEYGIYRGGERIETQSEAEIYRTFGFDYIVPELREMRGELEAAKEDGLPHLVACDDLQGDLHFYSRASIGMLSLEQIAALAKRLGYRYIALTERAMAPDALLAHFEAIDRFNEEGADVKLLKGVEAEIGLDGALSYGDDILHRADVVIAAVHEGFELSKARQTARLLRAITHPRVHIIAHPTCRIIASHEGVALNMAALFEAAKEHRTALEVHGHPKRLDLNDIYIKAAKEAGVMLALGSGGCDDKSAGYLHYALNQARRGWLEKTDLLNTLDTQALIAWLKSDT